MIPQYHVKFKGVNIVLKVMIVCPAERGTNSEIRPTQPAKPSARSTIASSVKIPLNVPTVLLDTFCFRMELVS